MRRTAHITAHFLRVLGKSAFLTTPQRIRTSNLRFRRPMLYPIELAALGDRAVLQTNRLPSTVGAAKMPPGDRTERHAARPERTHSGIEHPLDFGRDHPSDSSA